MSKATIVSVCPFAISEHKAGFYPCSYTILAAEKGGLSVLPVVDGYFMVILDSDRPPLRVSTPAEDVAKSVISDYATAQLGYTHDRGPGLFWVESHVEEPIIRSLHSYELQRAIERQDKWFEALILQADDEWAKFHQHRMITDTQRHAAKHMDQDREWSDPTPKMEPTIECPVCLNKVSTRALLCGTCRVVMPGREAELEQFTFGPKPAVL